MLGLFISRYARKGEGVDTCKNVRRKVPFCMYSVIFLYARYFCNNLLSLVTTFVTVS